MHDLVDLEIRGIPGVFVASSEFVQAADAQATMLGMAVARVFVPHPIQDRSDDEMRSLAAGAFPAIVAAVTAAADHGSR